MVIDSDFGIEFVSSDEYSFEEIKYNSKEEVLKEIELIFNSFTSIQLHVVDIYNSIDIIEDGEHLIDIPSDNKFICQIEISFDNKESLRVIDLIEFDNSGKIKNLTAYKR